MKFTCKVKCEKDYILPFHCEITNPGPVTGTGTGRTAQSTPCSVTPHERSVRCPSGGSFYSTSYENKFVKPPFRCTIKARSQTSPAVLLQTITEESSLSSEPVSPTAGVLIALEPRAAQLLALLVTWPRALHHNPRRRHLFCYSRSTGRRVQRVTQLLRDAEQPLIISARTGRRAAELGWV